MCQGWSNFDFYLFYTDKQDLYYFNPDSWFKSFFPTLQKTVVDPRRLNHPPTPQLELRWNKMDDLAESYPKNVQN